jgi:hypothetical protein
MKMSYFVQSKQHNRQNTDIKPIKGDNIKYPRVKKATQVEEITEGNSAS